MGTRAAFWIGDPTNLDEREWLGCVAFDGYQWLEEWADNPPKTADEFRQAVRIIERTTVYFAAPAHGWPYPWDDDIFLTDITYAFIDGEIKACWFHKPFASLAAIDSVEDVDDPAHMNVPAPGTYNPAQPDSIIVVALREGEGIG